MNIIQSNLVPLELSFDNGSTWQALVCMKQYNIPITTATNTAETFCGVATGVGAITFNPTGSAVCEASPNAGQQVTLAQMIAVQLAQTLIKFRAFYPQSGSFGNNIFLKGDCYVTSVNPTFQTNQVVQFDFTLTGTGTLDNVYP